MNVTAYPNQASSQPKMRNPQRLAVAASFNIWISSAFVLLPGTTCGGMQCKQVVSPQALACTCSWHAECRLCFMTHFENTDATA
jgi:hypothetical protein